VDSVVEKDEREVSGPSADGVPFVLEAEAARSPSQAFGHACFGSNSALSLTAVQSGGLIDKLIEAGGGGDENKRGSLPIRAVNCVAPDGSRDGTASDGCWILATLGPTETRVSL
jgi:hypothetical protein